MIGTLALTLALTQSAGGCRAVDGEHILAADLAAEIEAFAAAPPAAEIATAPAPGARRLIHAAEIQRQAERLGVSLNNARTVCFERRLNPIEPDRVRAALEEALASEDAQLELVDFPRAPVPAGTIEFPRFGLSRPAGGAPAIWRGRIRYGSGRTYPIWASVRLRVRHTRVIAIRALTAGRAIEADAIEVRQIDGFPFEAAAPASLSEVAGRSPRRTIPAGQPIEARNLVAPREVEAGSQVEVEARGGSARIVIAARAESSGRIGDTVMVRNPVTGKRLRGVVQAKGRVAAEETAGEDRNAPSHSAVRRATGVGGAVAGEEAR